jgi:predicted RNase H-like HicB family nuclease
MKGVVVAQGDSFDEAVRDAQSAIHAHIQTFGSDAFDDDDLLEAFVAETSLTADQIQA